MVRPVDLNDFYLQTEGGERIHQIKKADPETEKKQFHQELTKKMKDHKGSNSEDESATSKKDQEEKPDNNLKSDHHIDLTA